MIGAELFVSLIIIAVTQMIKMAAPTVKGWVTILVAFIIGIVVATVDGYIGVTDISIAAGVVYSLTAIGVTAVASKAGGGAPGDPDTTVR